MLRALGTLQITAALLSGNQQQASRLIKQGLQSGNTGAVSKALASASANVSISSVRHSMLSHIVVTFRESMEYVTTPL